ncbi:MAG: acetyl-CoA synthase subunit gamma [Chitinivibrionales bacterium]|nr:acetyl-CoA synthase subunit gamma [Chitinivibrionales bacterium]MBD3394371.1 acetyl-CoA synthase subunit gamma [Chitinivibrionales bacterium]
MGETGQCGRSELSWGAGTVDTPAGRVTRVKTTWGKEESRGHLRCRLSNRYRMSYRVEPGLYATGDPGRRSPAFVTANYKLTFDTLRRRLAGIDSWILVLDTKNINVWCAAGKGTFGTDELVRRLRAVGLDKVVEHRRLVVPQLGATGVAAHDVRKKTGFSVSFGPVYARDIPAYLEAGYRATDAMRRVRFTIGDRFELTWMELAPAMKYFPLGLLATFVLMGIQPEGIMYAPGFKGMLPMGLALLAAIVAGGFLTPVFLPYLPSRSFAFKGWICGVVVLAASRAAISPFLGANPWYMAVVYLVFPVISSFVAVNFTGTSTFTSPSGVKKELKIATPLYVLSIVGGLAALVMGKLLAWGIV